MKRYTVKQVAELSGVSVRTLHFYDEIGLLKPADYGENGYRYYEREQLLLLQQVLFYRKLGFSLEQIQEIVGSPKFDKVKALRTHRTELERDAIRLRELIETIDKTIVSIEEEKKMKDKDLYKGFAPEKQKEYESYLVDRYGKEAEDHIAESKKRVAKMSKEKMAAIGKEGEEGLRALSALIEQGAQPSNPEVQKQIAGHYQWICNFWTPNRESYTGLGQLYVDHPDFRKYYEPFHPKLVEFLAEAMRLWAEANLK